MDETLVGGEVLQEDVFEVEESVVVVTSLGGGFEDEFFFFSVCSWSSSSSRNVRLLLTAFRPIDDIFPSVVVAMPSLNSALSSSSSFSTSISRARFRTTSVSSLAFSHFLFHSFRSSSRSAISSFSNPVSFACVSAERLKSV